MCAWELCEVPCTIIWSDVRVVLRSRGHMPAFTIIICAVVDDIVDAADILARIHLRVEPGLHNRFTLHIRKRSLVRLSVRFACNRCWVSSLAAGKRLRQPSHPQMHFLMVAAEL